MLNKENNYFFWLFYFNIKIILYCQIKLNQKETKEFAEIFIAVPGPKIIATHTHIINFKSISSAISKII